MVTLEVNGKSHELDIDPSMPLLWAIRDHLGLTGTKYGCGLALCGSCTVLVDGAPVRACQQPAGGLKGKSVTTIEGLDSTVGKAVQAAWERLDVVQCGYCQSGQILAATALLAGNPDPTEADINRAMSGNICRCATYVRIRAAIREAARAVS